MKVFGSVVIFRVCSLGISHIWIHVLCVVYNLMIRGLTLSFCLETDTNLTSEMSHICFQKWSKGNIHFKAYRGPNNFGLKIVTVLAFCSSLEFLYLVVLNGVVLSLKLLQTIICC